MNRIWIEHSISILLVNAVLIVLIFYFNNKQKDVQLQLGDSVTEWTDLDFIDFDNPMHRAMLEESLNIFDSTHTSQHADLIKTIVLFRRQQLTEKITSSNIASPINKAKIKELLWMYGKFVLVFLITMFIVYYCVQTLGTYRFILYKRKQLPYLQQFINHLKIQKYSNWKNLWRDYYPAVILFFKVLVKGILYMILFSPAYVLAYSFRTKFATDMLFFMVLLGVISNALLITYANKFYTFLLSESRKGYVQTAIVKNMFNSYKTGKEGISPLKILRWKKVFPGHVFGHIYENARFQYISTIKEQASFLITGLIIIEMALNIQDHLCYELLQNILYANYAVVTSIVLGIFCLVKGTEVVVDFIQQKRIKELSN